MKEGKKVGRRKVDGNKEDIKTKGRKGMKVIRRKEGKQTEERRRKGKQSKGQKVSSEIESGKKQSEERKESSQKQEGRKESRSRQKEKEGKQLNGRKG